MNLRILKITSLLFYRIPLIWICLLFSHDGSEVMDLGEKKHQSTEMMCPFQCVVSTTTTTATSTNCAAGFGA